MKNSQPLARLAPFWKSIDCPGGGDERECVVHLVARGQLEQVEPIRREARTQSMCAKRTGGDGEEREEPPNARNVLVTHLPTPERRSCSSAYFFGRALNFSYNRVWRSSCGMRLPAIKTSVTCVRAFERIAIRDEHIGRLADFDRADAIGHAPDLRGPEVSACKAASAGKP